MSQKICKNCKFWGYYIDQMCDKITHINTKAEIVVHISDDTGLDAQLKTSPDFGCNQFQKIV